MGLLRKSRWVLLALLLSLVPASSFAGVLISVGFAPPVLPVYDQPPCPQPGWMWTPGYWAYGDDGYYWVPGAWVPAPYEGALWTPPYWGWSSGLYVFHPGYWGPHVGYYGGVNYGFGYMGVGFVGGMWRGHDFVYNTAVVHVNNVYIHNTYVDRTVVERNTIVNEHRVSYSGGEGGIRHEPGPEERSGNERTSHGSDLGTGAAHAGGAFRSRLLCEEQRWKSAYCSSRAAHGLQQQPRRGKQHARPQQNSYNNNHGAESRPQYQQQQQQHQRRQHQQGQQHQQAIRSNSTGTPSSRTATTQQPHNESHPAQQHEQPSMRTSQHEPKEPKEPQIVRSCESGEINQKAHGMPWAFVYADGNPGCADQPVGG